MKSGDIRIVFPLKATPFEPTYKNLPALLLESDLIRHIKTIPRIKYLYCVVANHFFFHLSLCFLTVSERIQYISPSQSIQGDSHIETEKISLYQLALCFGEWHRVNEAG